MREWWLRGGRTWLRSIVLPPTPREVGEHCSEAIEDDLQPSYRRFAEAVRTPDGVPIAWPEGAQPLRWRDSYPRVRIDHETFVNYRWWDQAVIAKGRIHGPYHGTGAQAHVRSLYFNLALTRREGPAPVELPDDLRAVLDARD